MNGLDLAEGFFADVVSPLVEERFPELRFGAALLGRGSEVLGYDDAVSPDHDFGPQLQLLLERRDAEQARAIVALLSEELPATYRGFPTRYPFSDGRGGGEPRHHVWVTTVRELFARHLGVDWKGSLSTREWLSVPPQVFLELTCGRVFRDGVGLEESRAALAWYPDGVWRYLLASGWLRVGQEQPFVGRTGQVGDELGSRILTARLAHDLMALGFLVERRYPPYSKWLGTAFAKLELAGGVAPHLHRALGSGDWRERDAALSEAASHVLARMNALALCDPLPTDPKPFFDRPFTIIDGEGVARALLAGLPAEEEELRALPPVGGLDQWSDSTDLKAAALRPAVVRFFASLAQGS